MSTLDLNHKLFIALVFAGFLANLIWFLFSMASSGWSSVAAICLICSIASLICTISGLVFSRITVSSFIMILLLNWFEFPVFFYLLGGAAVIYFSLGLFIITAYITGRLRTVIFLATAALDLILLGFDMHPSGISSFDSDSRLVMIYAYVVSAVTVYSISALIEIRYEAKNDKILLKTQKLEQEANVDPLTQVYNRRYMMNTLEKTLKQKEPFFISLLDIDDFKNINDTYGHVYGDEILSNLGRLMIENSPSDVVISRYGGEEFFMLYRNGSADDIIKILNTIKDKLGDYSQKTRNIRVTFSCGVVKCTGRTRSAFLISHVDKKLYEAKTGGKNRIVI